MKPHPRQCHLCPHNGKRHQACINCIAPALGSKGESIVSLDALGDRVEFSTQPEVYKDDAPTPMPKSHMLAMIRERLRQMGWNAKKIKIAVTIIDCNGGKTVAARRLGISPQVAFRALSTIAGDSKDIQKAFRITRRKRT
jgi:hypothetical protein